MLHWETRRPNPLIGPLFVAALFFAAVAPTLSWMEFSNGSEVLNVQGVLEIRRGGPWLVPTMQGEPRVAKPPLTAWLGAAAVRPSTVSALSTTDSAARDGAYHKLAWEIRWPSLLSTCLALMAVYALGRTLGGETIGLVASLVCATTFLVIRLGRYSTTDVQLFLWVNVANLLIARALLRGNRWRGTVLAGLAIGLAFMSKGPVALVQTIVPAIAFVIWDRWSARRRGVEPMIRRDAGAPRWWGPLITGTALMAVVGLTWFVWMLVHVRDIGHIWMMEVTREGATELPPDRWSKYIELFLWVFPWTAFLVVGIVVAARAMVGRGDVAPDEFARNRPAAFALIFVIVPLLIMSFVSDRKDRYALPMLGPAAIVIAYGLAEHFRAWHRPRWAAIDVLLVIIQWIGVAVIGIGLPLLLSPWARHLPWIGEQLADVEPLMNNQASAIVLAGMTVLVLAGVWLHRRWPGGIVAGTVVVMLVAQAIGFRAYSRFQDVGRSDVKPLADAIWAAVPDAEVSYIHPSRRIPEGVSIYLNRNAPRVADASTIRPSNHPHVAIFPQSRGEPDPVPPPGWRPLAIGMTGKKRLHAFVLPPVNDVR